MLIMVYGRHHGIRGYIEGRGTGHVSTRVRNDRMSGRFRGHNSLPVLFPTTGGLFVLLPAPGKMISSISGSSKWTSSGLIRMMGPGIKHISQHSAVSYYSKLPPRLTTRQRDRQKRRRKELNENICFVRTELTIFPMPFINGAEKLASTERIVVNLWQVRQGWAKVSSRA